MGSLRNRTIGRFSVRDLVLIAAMAALGIAVKPIVVPLAHLISTPLMIPGGALAGGLYMMWMVVAMGLTGRRGTAFMVGLVQALLVMLTGVSGSHGAVSLLSYTLPGAVMDLGLLLARRKIDNVFCAFLAGILANVTGTAVVNLIFFSLPIVPLLLSLFVSAFSGALGGLLSWQLLKALARFGIATKGTKDETAAQGPSGC
jgi:hypothetical protein